MDVTDTEEIVVEQPPVSKSTAAEGEHVVSKQCFLFKAKKEEKTPEMPVHEVEERSTVTLTIERPEGTLPSDLVVLKNGEPVKPSEHVKITSTSSTTMEIEIIKVQLDDAGDYIVKIKGVDQPLVRLIVHPKPVVRQEMQLPKTQFHAKETLTIVCQFDSTPEEPFLFLHNGQPIVADSRVTTSIDSENNKYTIVVKDLRPDEDEGVYTLQSEHLVLDTPVITVLPEVETTTIEEEEQVFTIVPNQAPTDTASEKEVRVITLNSKEKVGSSVALSAMTPIATSILQPEDELEFPVQEVEETTTVTLTVDVPLRALVLLKDGQPITSSVRLQIVETSSTTTEIRIIKVKPDDEGKYTIRVDDRDQPLMQLKVIPKPVTRQTMDLPQTTFNQGETLTIKCQFDSAPDEPFEFLRNGQPLIADDRITLLIEETSYTIIVKNLRPDEDEGVYTLASTHLILDTPSITIKPVDTQEMTVEEMEEETIVIEPMKKPEVLEIEIVEKTDDKVGPLPFVFALVK